MLHINSIQRKHDGEKTTLKLYPSPRRFKNGQTVANFENMMTYSSQKSNLAMKEYKTKVEFLLNFHCDK